MKFKLLLAIFVTAILSFAQVAISPFANAECEVGSPNCDVPIPGAGGSLRASGVSATSPLSTYTAYATWVVNDVDSTWTAWFSQIGASLPPAATMYLIQPGQTFTSQCKDANGNRETTTSDTPNAFFCPVDVVNGLKGALIIPMQTLANMWVGNILGKYSGVVGDFAAAFVLAHEYAHNVQYKLSLNMGWPTPNQPYRELIADCFAGNWVYTVYGRGIQDATDIQEAVAAISTFTPSASHGSPSQRLAAMQIGLSGNPYKCIQAYWK